VALPFYIKKYLKAKRRFIETQIFHHAKYNLQKHPLEKKKKKKKPKSFKIL
jgi:hypothetical protein